MSVISAISLLHQKPAPQLTTEAINLQANEGNEEPRSRFVFDLNQHISTKKRWTLLIFHPVEVDKTTFLEQWRAISGHCHLFNNHSADIFVCPSDVTVATDSSLIKDMEFSILLDEKHDIAKSYEVLSAGIDGQHSSDYVRAVFMISPSGIIKRISLYESIITTKEMDDLLALLIECQSQGNKEGWNQAVLTTLGARQSLLSLFSGLSEKYQQSLVQFPVITKSLTSALIGMVGEIIGSSIHNYRKSKVRSRSWSEGVGRSIWEIAHRTIVFGIYGLSFTGPFFHWWYKYLHSLVNSWSLPPQLSLVVKVLINQLAMTPPFLLFTISFLQFFLTFDRQKTIQVLKNSFVAALFMNWKVWTVAQLVNFSIVPMDYQVLFGNLVALWWNIYLSLIATTAPSN